MAPIKQEALSSLTTPEPLISDSQCLVGYPFHQYHPTVIEPCAITDDQSGQPFHLLTCGHIVAIDNDSADHRCGLNCLHVANWVRHQTIHSVEEHIDLNKAGKPLAQAVTMSTPLQVTKTPLLPNLSRFQSHDKIYCETCQGIPVSSYFIMTPKVTYKRALALTRPVIEHFARYTHDQIHAQMCKPFYNPDGLPFDHKLTHTLHCGHEVWAQPARPCGANCIDMPACRGRIFPGNEKQGDAILCHECVWRAEKVYERYAQVGRAVVQKKVVRNRLPFGGLQGDVQDLSQSGVPNGTIAAGYNNYSAQNGVPPGSVPMAGQYGSFSSSTREP
ncbi:hypothetical protein N0V90_011824 [Kalmusia sp. IMI 367209]|nr:hypothetical protein N0V90_011824 [Kalmusia sp. IMI 367209]